MSHTHAERYWHRHEHLHPAGQHWHAHQHVWAQTHDHGDGDKKVHSHKAARYHPAEGEVIEHHGPPGAGPCVVCGLSSPADPHGYHEAGHEESRLTHKDKEG